MHLTKTDKIRRSYKSLKKPTATNREVVAKCQKDYGLLPSPQLLRSAIGSEKERRLSTVTGQQLIELRKLGRRLFDGNFARMSIAAAFAGDV